VLTILTKWLLVGWLVCAMLAPVAKIGKPRQPIDPLTALNSVIGYGAIAVAVILLWHTGC
jgi:hypothetical protein